MTLSRYHSAFNWVWETGGKADIRGVIYMDVSIPAIFILLGLFLIVGTKCNLWFLVDPTEKWSPGNSFSFIKKHFGKEYLILTNYLFGIVTLAVGLFILFRYCLV
ncbi:MAG: hypothetical protein Q8880_11255 [Bacteroidota bacterium]|nr:hypothetical protein [Bacteroidota bacterium]